MLGLTDGEIHRRTGISRTTINNKRTGASPVRPEDLWPLSDALGVDIDTLLLRPSDAARWLTEHRPELLDGVATGPGNDDRQHNGEQNGTSHLSSKGSRDCRIARQHNKWSYMLGVSATAA